MDGLRMEPSGSAKVIRLGEPEAVRHTSITSILFPLSRRWSCVDTDSPMSPCEMTVLPLSI